MCKSSTNPIWRLTPVFGQLGSCNGKTKLVVVDNGAAGRKSDGWSMNLKRVAREGRSSAEAVVWRWARCSDVCARGVRQLKLRVADLYRAYFVNHLDAECRRTTAKARSIAASGGFRNLNGQSSTRCVGSRQRAGSKLSQILESVFLCSARFHALYSSSGEFSAASSTISSAGMMPIFSNVVLGNHSPSHFICSTTLRFLYSAKRPRRVSRNIIL